MLFFWGRWPRYQGNDDHFGKKLGWEKEVIKFVKEYQQDGLFDFNPGLEHNCIQSCEIQTKTYQKWQRTG